MFEAIKYVTGGLTLVAFIAAVVAALIRTSLKQKEGLIRSATDARRNELVDTALEGFRVDTADLTKRQKYELLTARMVLREGRLTKLLYFGLVIAIVAGIGYLWLSKSQGSPYVHWSSVVTDLPLQQCEALTREAYRLTGIVETENPVMDESSVGQVGIAAPVTSVIVCVRTGEKTTVMVIASGPDQTITQNRQAQLRDVVQNELPRLLRSQ
jgi:hypothetical protein